MKDPAFLFYPGDWLGGTMGMTLEEKGAYLELLMLQFNNGKFTEAYAERMIGIRFTQIWEILKNKFNTDGIYFWNKRLGFEIEKRKNYCESRRQSVLKRDRSSDKKTERTLCVRKTYVKHMENENENKDRDRDKDVIGNEIEIINNIVSDLNFVLGTSYKNNSRKTSEMIKSRLNDGFNLDDFKIVHRKMLKSWGADEKMCKYLRPITLYSNKFESYRNQIETPTILSAVGLKAYLIGQEWLKHEQERENQNVG